MQTSRFNNIVSYGNLNSDSRSKKSVFEKVRCFFWNYPEKISPFFENIISHIKKVYDDSLPFTPILLILVFLAFVVIGTYYVSNVQWTKNRDTLIEGVLGMPSDFNVIYLPSYQAQKDVYQLVYDRLFKVLPDGSIQGELVESWAYEENGKNLRIILKSPVYWHDGVELTSSDVKFTIELFQGLEGQDSYYDTVSDVEVEIISANELILKKTRVSASFIETINWPILPQHILENNGMQNALSSGLEFNLIGSGPYKFSSITIDEITLIKNENYWNGDPQLNTIIFRSYNSEKSLVNALEAGKIDATTEITQLNIDQLGEVPWLEFDKASLLRRYWAIYFNFNGPEAIQNQKIRQAISSSINRQQIIEQALLGYAQEATGPIQQNSWAYNSEATRYSYNIEKSNQLFVDVGYSIPEGETYLQKDGNILEFELAYVSNPIQDEVAKIIYENLETIGIKVNLIGLSYTEFRDTRLLSRNFDMILFGVEGLLDPDHFNLWHSSQITAPGRNFSSYVSGYKVLEEVTRVDDALEKGKESMDQEERKSLYVKFQTYLLDEVPAVFLYHPEFIYTHNKNLTGVDLSGATLVEERFDNIVNWSFE